MQANGRWDLIQGLKVKIKKFHSLSTECSMRFVMISEQVAITSLQSIK
jgi:hypothetical protein